MALIAPALPTIGQPVSTEEPKLLSALETIIATINGGLDGANLATALVQQLGATNAVNVGRGKSIIAGIGTRTNAAYGALDAGAAPGPDRVSGVVLPTDGLIAVTYQATWQEAVIGAARAAIFIGANQLKIGMDDPGVATSAAAINSNVAATDRQLVSFPGGLLSSRRIGATAYPGDVTTGQAIAHLDIDGTGTVAGHSLELNGNLVPLASSLPLGGLCLVDAAAGTYDISVQFKASSGSVTVKNRKLRVWTIGF